MMTSWKHFLFNEILTTTGTRVTLPCLLLFYIFDYNRIKIVGAFELFNT